MIHGNAIPFIKDLIRDIQKMMIMNICMVIPMSEVNMKDQVNEILKAGKTAVVTFKKKDGTMRTMRATTNGKFIPAKPVVEDTSKPKRTVADNPDVAKVFDLDKQEWRSFRYDSVTQVEVE